MTTSGTYAFNPSLGEIVIGAFARCGVRRTNMLAEHMQDARFEANLMMADWAASGVNLWAVDQQTVPLVQGTATYTLPATTIFILDAYITTSNGGTPVDRIIFPVSRSDYAGFPEKTLQGLVTVFWFDRLTTPTVTFYYVPDGNGPYTFTYWRARQFQDSELSNGTTPEVPWRFLDAFVYGLAARLSYIYAPDRAQGLEARYQQAWQTAISSDTENVGTYILPEMRGFYR